MVNQRVHKALLPAQKDSCAQNGARLGWGTMVRKKILQKYQPLIQCWLDWHKQSLKKRNATSPHSWHKSRKPHSILLFRLAHIDQCHLAETLLTVGWCAISSAKLQKERNEKNVRSLQTLHVVHKCTVVNASLTMSPDMPNSYSQSALAQTPSTPSA